MIEILSKEKMKKYKDQIIRIDNSIAASMGKVYSTEQWNEDNFLCDRTGKWEYSFFVVENGVVEGCTIITEYRHNHLHINRLFVNPIVAKRGIGTLMAMHLNAIARDDVVKEINLFVNSSNKNAIEFYEKNHFIRMKGKMLSDLMEQMGRKNYSELCFWDEDQNEYYAYLLRGYGWEEVE